MLTKHGLTLVLNVGQFQPDKPREIPENLTANTISDQPVAIPHEDRALYGLQEGQVKMMEKYGGNFVAHIEVFHHLHCLVSTKISLDYSDWIKAD
ncbi:conserved hypothetical protein [Trichophyton verrucosum HKI 0517]|uniref:Uncharacterized protein n=1 Tax=Trichophyton verrucosum (strain HKI 0517) TaxID=663202 RepID=D4DLR9_TRIVH|nr:uncharacterized protein TRV_08143 [Trichophyton verrucosum HKI 0517]EFE37203.1 conserved hypothetical protein [Trichophyton verrucosum HKI 0517]